MSLPDAATPATQAPAGDTETPACPLCGGSDYQLLMDQVRDRLFGKPGRFQIQRCGGCGLVATRPRPAAHVLGNYYRGVYSGVSQARAMRWQNGWLGRWVAGYRLRKLWGAAALSPSSHLLDIGCGYGEFLRLARERTGCQGHGIDMDATSIRHATRYAGAHCVVGELNRHDWGDQRFDVLTFFESLEHHVDPVAALTEAHGLLKPGGCCVVEVPDFDGLWRHVFGRYWMPLLVPQHLYHFTSDSLAQVLARSGFVVETRRSMWFPLESTASLGLWLHEVAARLWPGFRLSWRRPTGIALAFALALWWLLVELPSQTILWMTGRSGHMLVLARKAGEPDRSRIKVAAAISPARHLE